MFLPSPLDIRTTRRGRGRDLVSDKRNSVMLGAIAAGPGRQPGPTRDGKAGALLVCEHHLCRRAEADHGDEDRPVVGADPQRRSREIALFAGAANGIGYEAAGRQDVEAHATLPAANIASAA